MLETQDLKDFSITTWYEQFKEVTLKTIIIEIPPELLAKLRAEDFNIEIKEICSEEYVNQLKNAISLVGNEAFIKDNWHAPIDAKFMSFGNTLKVTNVSDLLLFLTASDIIMSDLENEKFNPYCIALRPWINIHPASEFRCIVINDVLRGISPRDWPTFYGHYAEDGPNIIKTISNFFDAHIRDKFSRKNYVFDVIITYPDSVSLVDFGPINAKTNFYAFSWKEIQPIIKKGCVKEVAPVFRYLETDIGIMTRADAVMKISNALS